MLRISLVVAGMLSAVASASAAQSAVSRFHAWQYTQLPAPICHETWLCRGEHDCTWRRICSSPCPAGNICYPLYGAYGPYGGQTYWGAYGYSGWGVSGR